MPTIIPNTLQLTSLITTRVWSITEVVNRPDYADCNRNCNILIRFCQDVERANRGSYHLAQKKNWEFSIKTWWYNLKIYWTIMIGKSNKTANFPTQNHNKDHLNMFTEARRKNLLHVKIVKLLVNLTTISRISMYNLHQSSSVS